MRFTPAANSILAGAVNAVKAQSPQNSCEICGIFDRIFDENDLKGSLSREKAFEERCTVHTPLLKWVEDKYNEVRQLERKAGYRSRDYKADGFYFARKNGDIPLISVTDYKDRPQFPFQIIPHKRSALISAQEGLHTSTIDPEWVDLGIAKSWLDKCITEHASKCQTPPNLQAVSPAWLIDTKDSCLVPGATSSGYVALSYRWGSSTAPQMDKDIFNKMAIPGGLLKQKSFLTPTVRHAIHTVQGLGERYLWVDAICLAPEDTEQMSQQLQLMGAIYASAKLTIVALDGDASIGFQGLEGESAPRKLSNLFPWKDDTNLLLRNQPKLSAMDVQASQYFTRGWTYQEYMLSQRRLIFGNQQIHWKCSCGDWHEDLPAFEDKTKGKSVRPHSLGFPNIKRGLSDVREFGILLNEYNARELKYPEDAYPAANGLLNYLGSLAFPGGFLFGLPKVYFGIALMWTIEFGMTNLNSPQRPGLRRREPSERSHSILPNTHLPSWSWVGWSGYGVHMLDREAQFRWADLLLTENASSLVQLIRNSSVTLPITEWFSHSSKDLDLKQALPRCATVYTEGSRLPWDKKVWTRKDFNPTEHGNQAENFTLPFGFSGEYVYEHINLPGKHFWWPLPPGEQSEQDELASIDQSPFISCKAKRAWFGAVEGRRYSWDVLMDAHLRLLDKKGRLCGWLQLPNNDELSRFPKAEIADELYDYRDNLAENGVFLNPMPERNELVELVAICLCKFPDINKMEDEIQYKEFYGVLWVEWNHGIAYRKGCGYVKKELWEEQELEDVDLILG